MLMRCFTLVSVFAILAVSANAQSVDLTGAWRVSFSDSPAYSRCDFDDSNWKQTQVPGGWKGDSGGFEGTGWLRIKFTVPDSPTPQDMIVTLGAVDDEDQTYFNGEQIGAGVGWNKERTYAVPGHLIKFGGENCIAVRVVNKGDGGGIVSAPAVLRNPTPKEGGDLLFFLSEDRKAFFSDALYKSLPRSQPFNLTWVNHDGVRAPRINGQGFWGTNCFFSNLPMRTTHYEAPLLAQQGWNNLRLGIRPVGYNLKDWVEVTRVLGDSGIAAIWSAYGIHNNFIATILGMEEGALGNSDEIVRENGERRTGFAGMGVLGNPWNPQFLANSDALWSKVSKAMVGRNAIGFQVSNEIQMENGSYDPYARADWQQFLKTLFGDDAPNADSNGDGTYFNKAYGKSEKSWDEVEQFGSKDLKNPSHRTLKDVWLGATYARYIQRSASLIHKSKPDAMVGASICVPYSATVDLSLVCAMPDVNVSFLNSYGCWLGGALLMADISRTYGRPPITSEMNYPLGNYANVRWTVLTLLPYYEGFQWFGYDLKDGTEGLNEEIMSEYGGKYGLIEHGKKARYDGDGDKTYAGDVAQAVSYDSRFLAFTQLAPFAGRLSSKPNDDILWILSSGYRPDYEEDHRESQVFRAGVTSDMAMVLQPGKVDLKKRKVIIYRNAESPCISKELHKKLREYVRGGGTVVTGAYHIGAGNTLLGIENKTDWWSGLEMVRGNYSGDGSTRLQIGDTSLEVPGTFQYLRPNSPDISVDGQVQDSTGASYPLVITRREGKGKWVLVNFPDVFRMGEHRGGFDQAKYDKRFLLLRAIVSKHTGINLPFRYEMQVYQGDRCALAMKEQVPTGLDRIPNSRPRFRADKPTVAFEIFEKKLYGGRCIEPTAGKIEMPCEIDQGEAKLWVVKPYGRPVALYADGTEMSRGRMDDGVFKNGTLKVCFCQEVYISSPSRPSSVIIGSKEVPFDYDAESGLLVIRRSGAPVEATVNYR